MTEMPHDKTPTGDPTTENSLPETPTDAPRRVGRGDAWLVWAVSLGAIAVPVIVLFTLNCLHTDSWRWDGVANSFDRGDFLVPVLILAADTVRRMWREATCTGGLAAFRILATFLCTVFCIACFAGVVVAAGTIGAVEGTAIARLTIGALVIALVFGTVAVGLPAKEASGG